MKRIGILVIVAATALALPSMGLAAMIQSTFDTPADINGWTLYGDGIDLTWSSTVGNPDGSMHGVDGEQGEYWGFDAPARFLGDQSANYGGSFSYDIMVSDYDTPKATVWLSDGVTPVPDVQLTGDGMTLCWRNAYAVPNQWYTNEVALTESGGWEFPDGSAPTQGQFKSVLGDLTDVQIRMEYHVGPDDEYMDNVVMAPTPEPTLMAMLAAGGVLLAIRRRGSRA